MTRPKHVAVRGPVPESLRTALADDHGVGVDLDGGADCTLATVGAIAASEERNGRTTLDGRLGAADDGDDQPVVALCSDAAMQGKALAAGADRCVTLTGDPVVDAGNVAAAVERTAERRGDCDALVRDALDALADFFFLFDTDMRLLLWNDAVTEVTGYTDEELATMNPLDLISEEDVVDVSAAVQRAISEGRATAEGDLLTKDGERIPYEFTGTALTDDDGDVLGISGIGRDVIERERRERTLERQAESLRTLNRINEVIRTVNHDLVRAESRDDVERAVVERLAGEDPYRFAWVGEYDAATDRVVPRVWAGEGEEYLDARESLTFDDGDATAATAVREGSMRVARHLDERRVGAWCEAATAAGFAAATAIPLVYHDVTYGVLCVYASRPDAFEGTERAVFGELGETVAYAISAAERRRALLTDTVVELELLVEGAGDVPRAASAVGASVEFRGSVPGDDGAASQFYRIDGDLQGVVDAIPDGANVSVVRSDEEGGLVHVDDEASFSSLLADHGGTIKRAHVEDGGFRIVATFPQGTDVRRVLDTVRENLPRAELVARREREREEVLSSRSDVGLTDRQLNVLTTAYHLGFFDSPRANTGGEVAEELGISTPTFHEHIRISERKLVEAYLDTTGGHAP